MTEDRVRIRQLVGAEDDERFEIVSIDHSTSGNWHAELTNSGPLIEAEVREVLEKRHVAAADIATLLTSARHVFRENPDAAPSPDGMVGHDGATAGAAAIIETIADTSSGNLEADLAVGVQAQKLNDTRLLHVEVQARVLADAVIAIADVSHAVAPAIKALKNEM